MTGPGTFHLGLNRDDLNGAGIALVPGDPARSEIIARLMDNPTFLVSRREFTSWRGEVNGKAVIVCSTGIGGPSLSIAVEELAQLGVRTFLRVGTTGAIQSHIAVGDTLITTGAVRLDGASRHFAPLAYPAVADFECVSALITAARAQAVPFHVGISASSDTFYPGQERYDTYSGTVLRVLKGTMEEWQKLHVMNFEMESATLFTMCAAMGLRAGMLSGVIVNRTSDETPDPSKTGDIERIAARIAVAAVRNLSGGKVREHARLYR